MAKHSFGWEYEFGAQVVAEVVNARLGAMEVTKCPSHALDSTNGVKTSEPGMVEPGTVTLTCRWNADVYAMFKDTLRTVVAGCVATFPDGGSTDEHDVYVSKLGDIDIPDDGPMMFDVELQISGEREFTPAA